MGNLDRLHGGDLEHMGDELDPLDFFDEADVEHFETILDLDTFSPKPREGTLKILDLMDKLDQDKGQTE